MTYITDPEILAKMKSYGYAPGNYMKTCMDCQKMMGLNEDGVAKGAFRCYTCAWYLVLDDHEILRPFGYIYGDHKDIECINCKNNFCGDIEATTCEECATAMKYFAEIK